MGTFRQFVVMIIDEGKVAVGILDDFQSAFIEDIGRMGKQRPSLEVVFHVIEVLLAIEAL